MEWFFNLYGSNIMYSACTISACVIRYYGVTAYPAVNCDSSWPREIKLADGSVKLSRSLYLSSCKSFHTLYLDDRRLKCDLDIVKRIFYLPVFIYEINTTLPLRYELILRFVCDIVMLRFRSGVGGVVKLLACWAWGASFESWPCHFNFSSWASPASKSWYDWKIV